MLEQYAALVAKFQSEYSTYSVKPTKASSKRLRDLANQMKKLSTPVKAHLVELDKAGY